MNDNPATNVESDVSDIGHQKHYAVSEIEIFDFLEALGIAEDFCIGNIIKYTCRYRKKNGIEDLFKAKWYLDELIKITKGRNIRITCTREEIK